MRGEYPSWTLCCVRENAPEMSACDATTAAAVAMIEERHLERRRGEQIERIARRRRIAEQQRALAEVVQQQRGKHDAEPGDADGPLAEVPHVGVERFTAGDAEHDGAEREKAREAVRPEELRGRATD